MTALLTKSLLVLLILGPIARSQSAEQSARAGEQKEIQEERNRKALALIDEIVEETRALTLAESRIRVEMTLIGPLWSRDEKRARSLFKEAAASLSELLLASNSQDPNYLNDAQMAAQLRQEMVQTIMRRDPRLALDFLRATRSDSSGQRSDSGQPSKEAQFEMSIAFELASRDPGEALIIGEAALKDGIGDRAIELLGRLEQQDKAVAQKFLGALLNRIRRENFNRDGSEWYVLLELLGRWIDQNRHRSRPAAQPQPIDLPPPILDDRSARELSGILIRSLLDNGPIQSGLHRFSPGRISQVVQQLMVLMPDTVSAGQVVALRKRIGELDLLTELQRGVWAKYEVLSQTGTAEALMEASKTAPPEIVANLVQNAVWKAFNEGDQERAHRIAESIADPRQRADMVLNIDRQLINLASEHHVAMARTLLSRIPSVEERARLMAQLAINAASKGDKTAALELVREGEMLVGNRALNYSQLGAQLQIAQAYGQLDPNRQAAIIETTIDRLNELAAAASVLHGFDLDHYFRSGEFIIRSGNPLCSSIQEVADCLGSMSLNEFDRARSLAERFQRREIRVMALLQIAQEALSSDN